MSKAITEDEVIYIRSQYDLLEPSKDGRVSLDNFRSVSVPIFLIFCAFIHAYFSSIVCSYETSLTKLFQALLRNATDAMKESRVHEILNAVYDVTTLYIFVNI